MARLQDVIGRGPTASRPSTPATGGIYFDTDLNAEFRWSGTAWESYERPLGTTATTAAAGNHAHTLASGDIPNNAADTTGTSGATNALKSATTTVNVSSATAPTTGQVLTATGASAATWQAPAAGFVNPMTTIDDLIIGGASGAAARLAKGADGQVLTVDPTTHHLVWATPAAGGMSNPMTTAGDIILSGSGGTPTRLAKGADSQFFFVDPTTHLPVWHTLVAADVPTLNQNTTGTAANVTGTVAIGNGGTGQTTQGAAFDALSPNTTKGDITVRGASGNVRLGVGTNGQVPTADSTAASGISWQTPASGGMTDPTTTTGDLIYHDAGGTTRLPIGTGGQILTVASGVPTWAANGAASGALTFIGEVALSTTQASVTFSSIPSSYRHLRLVMLARDNSVAADQAILLRFNGDTGSNYEFDDWYNAPSNTGHFAQAAQTSVRAGITVSANSTANRYGYSLCDIPYYQSAVHKMTMAMSMRHDTSTTSAYYTEQYNGLWSSTAAITSLTVFPDASGSFISGSKFSLYGIS